MTTILVVDDEPLITMALEAVLVDAGYRVVTAANGRQGLDQLGEVPRPDLVLLDMMMPVMTGPAMLAAMEADPDLRAVPVIVVSSLPQEAVRARAQNVSAMLRKPYTAHEILHTVTRVLDQARETGVKP